LVAKIADAVKQIAGVRSVDVFKVRVFSKADFAAKVGKGERYIIR
jgi:hypothetical protein